MGEELSTYNSSTSTAAPYDVRSMSKPQQLIMACPPPPQITKKNS